MAVPGKVRSCNGDSGSDDIEFVDVDCKSSLIERWTPAILSPAQDIVVHQSQYKGPALRRVGVIQGTLTPITA